MVTLEDCYIGAVLWAGPFIDGSYRQFEVVPKPPPHCDGSDGCTCNHGVWWLWMQNVTDGKKYKSKPNRLYKTNPLEENK